MTKINQIYKCNICGNIIEMLHTGQGQLVCCGQLMELMIEKNKKDEGLEKHVPVIKKTENGYKVKIGSVPHLMKEAHYIEWIEILTDGKAYRKFLKPDDQPEAEFCVEAENVIAREYCNIHGLWKSE